MQSQEAQKGTYVSLDMWVDLPCHISSSAQVSGPLLLTRAKNETCH
jgi:hypothetical protein